VVEDPVETVTVAVPVQPAAEVPVTVYVPAVVNEPIADVPPLLHK